MKISNKTYDILKWVAQILLPAIGTLYFALANIWGLPFAGEIVGTLTAIDACLGAILGISSLNYKGEGYLDTMEDGNFHIHLEEPIEMVRKLKSINLKVK